MRIFKANGRTGRTYYVFPRKKNPELAIEEAAREAHHHKDDMTIIPVWIKDGKQSNVEDVTQDIISDIVALPPVNPQPNTGHWVLGGYDDNYYICDRCNYKASEYYFKPHYNYCPNCGCRMVEPQESEGKE